MFQDPGQGQEDPHTNRSDHSTSFAPGQGNQNSQVDQDKYPGQKLGKMYRDPKLRLDIKKKVLYQMRDRKKARNR